MRGDVVQGVTHVQPGKHGQDGRLSSLRLLSQQQRFEEFDVEVFKPEKVMYRRKSQRLVYERRGTHLMAVTDNRYIYMCTVISLCTYQTSHTL